MADELFAAEYADGELIDFTGDGGFTVFSTKDEVESAMADLEEKAFVVRFVREEAPRG